MSDTTELTWEPIGPGPWANDPVHFPRPVTRYWSETHPEAFGKGTRAFWRTTACCSRGCSAPTSTASPSTSRVPSPTRRSRRASRAAEVLEGKLWREQLREWDEEKKPAAIAKHREIQAVDPASLNDNELVEYLRVCRDHHSAMITQHMTYTAGAVIPTGDFVAHVGEWTGISPAELLGLLRGAADVSAGGSDELEALKGVATDPAAMALLESDGDPAAILEQLRAMPGASGAAVAGWLDLVGNRPLDGFDISEPRAIELPEALLKAIRVSIGGRDTGGERHEDLVAGVRERVPEEHRAFFDELLGEARLMYRLRDERGVYSDIWASGLMRRARWRRAGAPLRAGC